jgi:methyltransferase (TIGR00027 family)
MSMAQPPAARARLGEGRPSRTAEWVALQRAAHQLLDDVPRVFDDPFALRILGASGAAALRSELARYRTESSRGTRAFLVMRSRFAEDELARAVQRGVRQYVVLGAGLDTFALRNPHGPDLRVFEVDHPATQRWKRERLHEAGVAPDAACAPVDFEHESLAPALRAAGFDLRAPAFFSWLGGTLYLACEAVLRTLREVAGSCAAGTEIVFDFGLSPASLSAPARRAREGAAALAVSAGEPWRSHFDPEELLAALRAMGFSRARHIDATEANARYFRSHVRGFRVRGSNSMILAAL